ncbi:WD40-repeat-containing domain protein [Flagelloscypha sp. PMI_526]|nr:WD40-repeat-containing domain protein [Flagelloscypha sp. PMI_526]
MSRYLCQSGDCVSFSFLGLHFPFRDLGPIIAREAVIHDVSTARNLALTNRELFKLCNPVLYQTVKLDTVKKLRGFSWTITVSPSLASHVRQLWTTFDQSFLSNILQHCTSLLILGIVTFHDDKLARLTLPPSVVELFGDPAHFTPVIPPYNPEDTVFQELTHLYVTTKLKKTDIWVWLGQAFIPNLQKLALEFNEKDLFLTAAHEISSLVSLHLPTMKTPPMAVCILLLFTKSGDWPVLDKTVVELSDGTVDPRVVLCTTLPERRQHLTGYILNVFREPYKTGWTSPNRESLWNQAMAMIAERNLTGKYPLEYYLRNEAAFSLEYIRIGSAASVVFSPDGRFIISGSSSQEVRLWDRYTRKTVTVFPFKAKVTSIAFSPHGSWIAAGCEDSTLFVWDSEQTRPADSAFIGHNGAITCIEFSPDGQNVISGSNDCTLRYWDRVTGETIGPPFTGHTREVKSLAFVRSGSTVVSGSVDGTLRVWEYSTQWTCNHILKGHTDTVTSISFSPVARRIVSSSSDKTICIWDTWNWTAVTEPICGHSSDVTSVAFHPDGLLFASGSRDKTVRIWDSFTLQTIGPPLSIPGYENEVTSIAFSPDGGILASGSSGRLLHISTKTFTLMCS